MGIAFQPYFKLKLIDLSDATQVNSGGANNEQNLQPDSGKVYQIVGMEYTAANPVGSTAGTHQLTIRRNNGSATYDLGVIISNTGSDIKINRNGFDGTSESPTAIAQQYDIMNRFIYCDNTDYITFRYINSTDANQTGTRTLKLWVKEYNERA